MENKELIRKLLNCEDILAQKLSGFANYSVDPQIRQILNQRSKKSIENKKELENALKNLGELDGRKMDG